MKPAIAFSSSLLLVTLSCLWGATDASAASPAAVLRMRYSELGQQLRNNHFGRPIALESAESAREVKGQVYAIFRHPLGKVSAALQDPSHWCDVLMLPINSKHCSVAGAGDTTTLSLGIGKMLNERPGDIHDVVFSFRIPTTKTDYFAIELLADSGPIGTSDYRILVEAIGVDSTSTFLHLTYSYKYGLAAHLAMQTYLRTSGRNKIGFTRTGKASNGQPEYIDGMRGVIERNSMRYYLAIEAFLGALDTLPSGQVEKRLNDWFTSTEEYPRQLREISRRVYLNLKRNEHRRLQATRS